MKEKRVSFGFMVLIMCVALLLAGGCTKTATVKDGGADQQMAAQKESAAGGVAAESKSAGTEMAASQKESAKGKAAAKKGKLKNAYTVKKGDCLWVIAKKKTVYNDPFEWPILYEANKDKIKNPNLIYPGQKLNIPRGGLTMDEVKKARKEAGAKIPYSPPAEAIVPI